MKYSLLNARSKNQFSMILLQGSVTRSLVLIVGMGLCGAVQAASGDTTAPTVPQGLAATATASRIDLSWQAAADDNSVKGYKVYQNGALVADVNGTSFADTGLSASKTYGYTVAAYDAAGNTSASSSPVSATTLAAGSFGDSGSVSASAAAAAPTVSRSAPAGIYSIDTIVDKPFVDGVLIRVGWDQIEKTQGSYDFSKIVNAVQQAEGVGQSVSVAMLAMKTPSWLLSKCKTFNSGNYGKVCVPWDSTMLSALQKLVNAMSTTKVGGTALKDHPAVKQIDASIGGIQSIRLMNLPSGYNATTFANAVYQSVGYWASAFPSKHLYVGLFGVSDGKSNPSTAESIRDSLLSKYKVNFFQEVLTGDSPSQGGDLGDVLSAVKSKTGIMFQACGEWKNQRNWSQCDWLKSDSPSAGMSNGYNNFNATYFEIYQTDLSNSAYSSQFQQWHNTLLPYLP
jgi:chitodextrinase